MGFFHILNAKGFGVFSSLQKQKQKIKSYFFLECISMFEILCKNLNYNTK